MLLPPTIPAGSLEMDSSMKRPPRSSLTALVVTALSACTATPPDYAAELRQADSDFAAATAQRGNDGWAEFFLPNGIMFTASARIEGRETIRSAMAGAFGPGTRLDWEPVTAVAGEAGDVGYTIGRWSSIVVRPDGTDSVTAQGSYVTVWRRDVTGAWRVAADIGNREPAGQRAP